MKRFDQTSFFACSIPFSKTRFCCIPPVSLLYKGNITCANERTLCFLFKKRDVISPETSRFARKYAKYTCICRDFTYERSPIPNSTNLYYLYIDVATLPSRKSSDGRVARPIRMSPSLAGWPHPDRWTFEGIFAGATNFEFFLMKASC